ncbi:hypothetical protein LCH21_02855 [Patescibacteria group bacterium]|nr:hypothetical protein [Patescibacteria group bacterium]
MKIQKNNKPINKKIILAALVALSLLASYFAWTYFSNRDQDLSTNDSSSTGKTDGNKSSSDDSINYEPPTTDQQTTPTESAKTAGNISPKPDLNITISALDVSGDTLRARALITPMAAQGATCKMTLSRTGYTPITRTAGTQNLSSSSTCQGFDENISTLAPGVWTITLQVTSAQSTASTTKEVTL